MKLRLTYRQSETRDGLYAYALHILAEPADPSNESEDGGFESDPRIFVFRRSTPRMDPFGPNDRVVDDEFVNVATPVDMFEVPPDEPNPECGMPYFRSDTLDLWFRNARDVARARHDIDDTVKDLVLQLNGLSDQTTFKSEEVVEYT